MGRSRTNSGFVSLAFLFAMPLFASLIFFTIYFLHRAQLESKIQNLCYSEFFAAQKLASTHIDELIGLNPLSTRLRVEAEYLKIALASAIASFQYPAAAAIEARILIVEAERVILELEQNALISLAQAELTATEVAVRLQIMTELSIFNFALSEWYSHQPALENNSFAQLGVKALRTGLAPNYIVDPRIETMQTLTAHWHDEAFAIGWMREQVVNHYQKDSACGVKIQKSIGHWQFKIDLDRFW